MIGCMRGFVVFNQRFSRGKRVDSCQPRSQAAFNGSRDKRRDTCRPIHSKSSTGECRRAFFHECSRRFPMIIGTAGFDLTPGLEVEKLSESSVFRGVEILLHQSERDAWAPRQLPCE